MEEIEELSTSSATFLRKILLSLIVTDAPFNTAIPPPDCATLFSTRTPNI